MLYRGLLGVVQGVVVLDVDRLGRVHRHQHDAKLELDALHLQVFHLPVDDSLVELEVRNAEAQQSACVLASVVDGDLVALLVELSGYAQSRRASAHHGHLLAVARGDVRMHEVLVVGVLYYGRLVFAGGRRLVLHEVEHARLLAEARADAPGELREVVGGGEQLVGEFPIALIQCVVPFRHLVVERTSPVAERHAAIHATACLQLPVARVERLLHLAEIVYSIMYWTVAGIFAFYLQKSSWITHVLMSN